MPSTHHQPSIAARKNLRRIAAGSLAAAILAVLPSIASAATRSWTGAVSNFWNNLNNWSPSGLPAASDTINFTETDGINRTINFDPTSATVTQLTIDLTGGVSPNTSTLSMAANTLTVLGGEFVGDSGASSSGTGTFLLSGGTNTIGASLDLGTNATDHGIYTLSNTGSLAVSVTEFIGDNGNGNFTQTGGSNSTANLILASAANSVGSYTLGPAGTLAASATENIGQDGTGTFTQTGGNNTLAINGIFAVGYNTNSNGTYTQSGGNVTLNSGGTFIIGDFANSTGTYNLSSTAALNVTGGVFVGNIGTGSFFQTGGAATISGNLVLGNSATGNGTLSLSAGTLSAANVYVGGSATAAAGRGNITISGTGQLTDSGTLTVYNNNSRLNLSGGSLTVASLNLSGNTSLFSWTSGNLTWTSSSNIFIENTSNANLASSLFLNSGQNLTSSAEEDVGIGGTGCVTQFTGSTNTILAGPLYLAENSSGTGTYNLSGGNLTVVSGYEFVGNGGNATFNQTGGNNTITAGFLNIAINPGSTAVYNLSAGNLTTNSQIYIGGGNGTLNQTGGTFISGGGGSMQLAYLPGEIGIYNISGGNATLFGSMNIGGYNIPGGTGILNVSGTANLSVQGITAYSTPNTAINLTGGTLATSSLNLNGNPSLLHWTGGTLEILGSLTLDSVAAATITSTSAVFGSAYTIGNNQTLAVLSNENIGNAGKFALTLSSGGTNTVGNNLVVFNGSTLILNGGTLSGNAISVFGASTRIIESLPSSVTGTTLSVTNDGLFLATDGGIFNFTGNISLTGSGSEIALDNNASLSAANVDVGNNTFLSVAAASISTSSKITVESGGELQLSNPSTSILSASSLVDTGLLDGSGRINAPLTISSIGELDVAASQTLTVTGTGSVNSGLISLTGGTLHFTQTLTNSLAITGFGTLRTDLGLINNSSIALGGQSSSSSLFGNITNSGGAFIGLAGNTAVFSNITNNSTGSVRLSGTTDNIFYGTFANNGSLSIDPNAIGIFYGAYTGTAPILNAGSIFINANSVSGAITGGGNLTLGFGSSSANLQLTPAFTATSKLSTLTFNANSQFDLTTNPLIIEATASTKAAQLATLKTEIATGFNSGLFNGPGIISTTALSTNTIAGKTVKVVAISDNAVRLATFPTGATNFGGGTNNADANSILILSTYKGDANLDGVVDIQDLTDVANHWQQPVIDWSQGDFDNSNFVDIQDLTAIANNWQDGVSGGGGQSFSEALAQIGGLTLSTTTPEPGTLAISLIGAACLLRRRSKKNA